MKKNDFSNEIDLRRYIRAVRTHRFLLGAVGVTIFLLAALWVWRKETVWVINSSMLIESSDSDGQSRGGSLLQMMRVFTTGGFASSSVDNEVLLVNTYDVARRTVKALDLNVACIRRNGIISHTLWEDAPLSLTLAPGMADSIADPFRVKVVIHGQTADIEAYSGRFLTSTIAEKKNVRIPYTMTIPEGSFTIGAVPGRAVADGKYIFSVCGTEPATFDLIDNVKAQVGSKAADGIDFEYMCTNKQKGRAVLNTLMSEYNIKRLERKKEIALTELNFITDRINSLHTDLVETENKVQKFKSENNFVDIEAEAPILLETSLNAREQSLKAASEILYYEQVLDILKSGGEGMLPSVSVPGEEKGSGGSGMVTQYNEQMALLMELRRSAKPGNKALAAAEERMGQMRSSIITSFSQLLSASRKAMAARGGMVVTLDSHLRKLPAMEKEYINLSRDQLLKNELYAFLVEKRENALMKINSTQTLGFVIDEAYVLPKPSSKRSLLLLLAGLVAAIGVPALMALWFMRRDVMVRDVSDLAPFGLENRTVECGLDEDGIAALRDRFMSLAVDGTVYAAADGGDKADEALLRLQEALGAAGISCADAGSGDADRWLSPQTRKDVEALAAGSRYVFARVMPPRQLGFITSAVNGQSGAMALVAIVGGAVRTAELSGIVAGLDPQKIMIIIAKA